MSQFKRVFFSETNQTVKWTQSLSFDVDLQYEYVGTMTKAEFDLLIEVLWYIHRDLDIRLDEFERTFGDIRTFCDQIKRILDEQ